MKKDVNLSRTAYSPEIHYFQQISRYFYLSGRYPPVYYFGASCGVLGEKTVLCYNMRISVEHISPLFTTNILAVHKGLKQAFYRLILIIGNLIVSVCNILIFDHHVEITAWYITLPTVNINFPTQIKIFFFSINIINLME